MKIDIIKLGKTLLKLVPLIGDGVENKDSEDGGKGKFQWGKFFQQIIRIAGTAAVTYFAS